VFPEKIAVVLGVLNGKDQGIILLAGDLDGQKREGIKEPTLFFSLNTLALANLQGLLELWPLTGDCNKGSLTLKKHNLCL
jgi:hypothetical protein